MLTIVRKITIIFRKEEEQNVQGTKVWKTLLSVRVVAATTVMMFRYFVVGAPEEQSRAVIYKILAVIVSVIMSGSMCAMAYYIEKLHGRMKEYGIN